VAVAGCGCAGCGCAGCGCAGCGCAGCGWLAVAVLNSKIKFKLSNNAYKHLYTIV